MARHTSFTSFSAAASRPRKSLTITATHFPHVTRKMLELSVELMATLRTFVNLSLYPLRKTETFVVFFWQFSDFQVRRTWCRINWFHSPALTSSGQIENYDYERFPSFLEVCNIHLTKFIDDAATLKNRTKHDLRHFQCQK